MPIALTYDDGMASHLSTAIPQLDSAGLRGTFFLNDLAWPEKIAGFTAAARSGHELGNHTLRHPCPGRMGYPDSLASERYTPARFAAELVRNDSLIDLLDGRDGVARSFAHPCGYAFVGDPPVSILPALRASGVVAAGRQVGDTASVLRPGVAYPRWEIPSFTAAEGTTAAELIAYVERVAALGGAGVITFHGIGGEWIAVDAAAHRALLAHLAGHPERFAVVTFAELVDGLTLTDAPAAAVP